MSKSSQMFITTSNLLQTDTYITCIKIVIMKMNLFPSNTVAVDHLHTLPCEKCCSGVLDNCQCNMCYKKKLSLSVYLQMSPSSRKWKTDISEVLFENLTITTGIAIFKSHRNKFISLSLEYYTFHKYLQVRSLQNQKISGLFKWDMVNSTKHS